MLVVFIVLLAISVGSVAFPIVAMVSSGPVRTAQPNLAIQFVIAALMFVLAIHSHKWFWPVLLAFLLGSLAEDYWYYRRRHKTDATAPLSVSRLGWQVFVFGSWIAFVTILYT